MLAKQYRFHGYGSLKFLYTRGKMVRSNALGLKYSTNPRRKESRLSVVVAKKITKVSPLRNRLRRRIYEIMRLEWPHIKPGHDLLITVFDKQIENLTPEQLTKEVKKLLLKAELYK